jgi:heptosyltransferase-2
VSRPIIVRLPNWVGDVVMALPALDRLEQAGFTPWLIGKRWASSLLAGHGWTFAPLGARSSDRIAQLRHWRDAVRERDPRAGSRPNALILPNSFSSAWEAWRAGLKAVGFRRDGRGLLLHAAIGAPRTPLHEAERFDQLATALVERSGIAAAPRDPGSGPMPRLLVAPADRARAQSLLATRIGPGRFACIVPFAAGKLGGRDKTWPAFREFTPRLAARLPVVVVPGPGEAESARADHPAAISLEGLDLGVYAAVLERAAVVIANDTGPAHVAAAVGAPLVSVLGPTDARRHRPLGPRVSVVQAEPWPTLAAVEAALSAVLDRPLSTP